MNNDDKMEMNGPAILVHFCVQEIAFLCEIICNL